VVTLLIEAEIMSAFSRQTIFYGPVITPVDLKHYKSYLRCLLSVGTHGDIDWLVEDVPPSELQNVLASKGCDDADVTELRHGEFLLPGFVDTHTVSLLRARKYCRIDA
jgi:guanine deaminase